MFELTDEQNSIKEAAREFAEKEFTKELALECEERQEYPGDLVKKAFQLGFPNLEFPKEYGGQGYTFFEKVLVTEEFCRASSTLGMMVAEACGLGATLVEVFGSEEQKRRYLVPALRGDGGIAGAFTEPAHGTDVTFLDTSAVKDGDNWVINGTKTLISAADVSAAVVVLCQTDPKAEPTYGGQTLFLVDAKDIEVSKFTHKLGLKALSLCELKFDNVSVEDSRILGQLNNGFYETLQLFNQIRVLGGARTFGMAIGAYEIALKYAKERSVSGRPLARFQGIRWMLAKMATEIELARIATYKAAYLEGQGKGDPALSAMVKSWVPERMLGVINEAMQILGGLGYLTESDVERRWRDARAFQFAGGTREMCLNTIASYLIDRDHKIPI
jgi:alkylation response protein AidB-like acyl-CoA dehydrogenase